MGTLRDTPLKGVSLCPPSPRQHPRRIVSTRCPGALAGCHRTGEIPRHSLKNGMGSSANFGVSPWRWPVAKWPYNTPEWKALRAAKLASKPMCEDCASVGRHAKATCVDHRRAISQGGDPFPPLSQLASLCWRCHSAKTARSPEAGASRTRKPRRGCDENGLPLDPSHPWATTKN